MIEREHELSVLEAAVASPRAVVIEAPPGFGKSSLLAAAIGFAQARGLPVHRAPVPDAGDGVVAIDDAHRLDADGLLSLVKLAARAELPVIATLRTGEPTADAAVVARLTALAHVLRPAPLSPAAIATLLGSGDGDATAGTPFLVAALAAGERERIAPWAADRVERLSPPARRLLATVAVAGEVPLRIAAPVAGLAPEPAEDAADAAAAAGLLAPGDPLRFAEPLTAQAVAAQVADAEGVRRRIAALLVAEGAPDALVAAQLMQLPPAGDSGAAETLAAAARTHPDPAMAARLLGRALREPPRPARRAALRLELAGRELAAGDPAAAASFEAIPHPDRWRGLVQAHMRQGRWRQAAAAAAQGRADGAAPEPLLALELAAALQEPGLPAPAVPEPRDPSLCAALAAWRGRRGEDPLALARRSTGALPATLPGLVEVLVAVDELALARELLAATDTAGDRVAEATVGVLRTYVGVFAGELRDPGEGPPLIAPLARRARLIVRRARGELAAAPVEDEPLLRGTAAWLALDRGDAGEALEQFMAAIAFDEGVMGIRDPGLAPWHGGAAIALARLGEPERAIELARVDVERARGPAARGRALSALATVSSDLGGHAAAVKLLEGSPSRLYLPAALLEQGAALRRAGRERDARLPLARAVELAAELGLGALLERARVELRAAGGRARRRRRQGAEALTPAERRVAGLARAGRTTPEIASELFVSPRTVEAQLRSVFRKLGIGSRGELAVAFRSRT